MTTPQRTFNNSNSNVNRVWIDWGAAAFWVFAIVVVFFVARSFFSRSAISKQGRDVVDALLSERVTLNDQLKDEPEVKSKAEALALFSTLANAIRKHNQNLDMLPELDLPQDIRGEFRAYCASVTATREWLERAIQELKKSEFEKLFSSNDNVYDMLSASTDDLQSKYVQFLEAGEKSGYWYFKEDKLFYK